MSQIRFHITGVDDPTEWLDEQILHHGHGEPTAVAAMNKLRPLYPNAAIRIERRGDVKIPSPVKTFRYKVVNGDRVGYSRPVAEQHKDALRTKIRDENPRAEITEEAI